MALALYRKYRPAKFAEVVGQEHVTEPLRTALEAGRINHAYLFSGPRGCGKTSSARILARSLNCELGPTPEPCGVCSSCLSLAPGGPGNIDVTELDAASHGGVDDTRELRDRAFFAPAESRYRVFIVDEAHMITTQGFNALLKIVEEPPEHLVFVFATTEPDKVLPTIRSRTHHYPFRLIPPGTLRKLMERICAEEGAVVAPAVYPLVIRAGGGSARDSLSVLDQLLAGAGPEGVTYERAVALLGVTDVSLIDDVVDALAASDRAAVFEAVDRMVEAGHDPRRFAADLLQRLRDLVLLQAVPEAPTRGLVDAADDEIVRMVEQADRIGPGTLARYGEIVHNGLIEMRGATAPRLLLELLCARMLLPAATVAEPGLLERLERLERRNAIAAAPLAGGDTVADPVEPPAAARRTFERPSNRTGDGAGQDPADRTPSVATGGDGGRAVGGDAAMSAGGDAALPARGDVLPANGAGANRRSAADQGTSEGASQPGIDPAAASGGSSRAESGGPVESGRIAAGGTASPAGGGASGENRRGGGVDRGRGDAGGPAGGPDRNGSAGGPGHAADEAPRGTSVGRADPPPADRVSDADRAPGGGAPEQHGERGSAEADHAPAESAPGGRVADRGGPAGRGADGAAGAGRAGARPIADAVGTPPARPHDAPAIDQSTAAASTPAASTPAASTPAGPTPAGPSSAGSMATESTGAGPTSAGSTAGRTAGGSATGGSATGGSATAGSTTAGSTTAGSTTAGSTTAGSTTAGSTTAGSTTGGQTTAGPTAAEPIPPEPTPTGPAPASGLDAAAIRRVWPEILTAAKERKKRTAALLVSATVRAVEGDTLVLSIGTAPLARLLSEQSNTEVIAESLHAVLGVRWRIRCEHGEPGGPGPAGTTPQPRGGSTPPAANPPPRRPSRPPPARRSTAPDDGVPLPPEPPDEDTPPDDEEAMIAEAAAGSPGPTERRDPEEAAIELLSAQLGARAIDRS